LEEAKMMENEKEIYFARRVLDTIRMVTEPKLCYEEEKEVVKKALYRYISYLESEQYSIGNR
jgi:hypothetical protein